MKLRGGNFFGRVKGEGRKYWNSIKGKLLLAVNACRFDCEENRPSDREFSQVVRRCMRVAVLDVLCIVLRGLEMLPLIGKC